MTATQTQPRFPVYLICSHDKGYVEIERKCDYYDSKLNKTWLTPQSRLRGDCGGIFKADVYCDTIKDVYALFDKCDGTPIAVPADIMEQLIEQLGITNWVLEKPSIRDPLPVGDPIW